MSVSPYFSYYKILELTHWVHKNIGRAPTISSNWQKVKLEAINCTKCSLCESRTHVVFGTGSENAKVMFIGEAPGFHEDIKGEPFVGRAGQLLNNMLASIRLQRESIYIANILKCRPPENRDPTSGEVAQCTPYLIEQIRHIKPKLLVAVGRIAAHYLLQTKASLVSMRQKIHIHAESQTPLIVTFHPAYLLRNPSDKNKAYLDLKFIKQQLE